MSGNVGIICTSYKVFNKLIFIIADNTCNVRRDNARQLDT